MELYIKHAKLCLFQIPGNKFGIGSHRIVYTAHDGAGYKTRCVFKVLVNSPKYQSYYHELPIYQMY